MFSLSNLCHNIFFPVETGFEHSVLEHFYIAHKNRQCYEYINSNLKLKYMDKRIEFISFFLNIWSYYTSDCADNR